ncbi:MAG: Wzt carbohydrate-binding domain-containing protein, partial [Devosia sp.]
RARIKRIDGWVDTRPGPTAIDETTGGTVLASSPPAHVARVFEQSTDDESWFDPTLVSNSRVEYETQGARIADVSITTRGGRQINVLKSGERYLLGYTVLFDRDVANVGFGTLIKTVEGAPLGGAATDFARRLHLDMAKAGTRYRVRFDLRWTLNTGTYFLNAGVLGTTDGVHAYSHRLLDALAFRIMPPDEQLATGYINFDPVPSYELVAEPAAPLGTS